MDHKRTPREFNLIVPEAIHQALPEGILSGKKLAHECLKGKEIVSSTGEAIRDGWITTKVKAKFFDDKLLKESDITVDTNDRVATLKGTVGSDEARQRAVMIASGTEGVLRVADEVVVKAE